MVGNLFSLFFVLVVYNLRSDLRLKRIDRKEGRLVDLLKVMSKYYDADRQSYTANPADGDRILRQLFVFVPVSKKYVQKQI